MQGVSDVGLLFGVVMGAIGIGGAIFGVCLFIVRSKDIQALKPQIDQIPLMNAAISDIRQDVGEMKGTLAVIPAIQADTKHNADDINDLKQRVRTLEQEKRG